MAMNEKDAPLLPLRPGPTRRPGGKVRVTMTILIQLLGLVAVMHFINVSWASFRPCAGGRQEAVPAYKPAQCPQVEPLLPSRESPSLLEMDVYFGSPQFRNETIARMAGAVRIPTESYDDMGPVGEDDRWDVMYNMSAYLAETFPLVHATLQLERVNTHGLLYTWPGSEADLAPLVLMAHQDVVPVAAATVGQWTHPPYSGHFDGRFLWGRGSVDCKNNLVGILEAVELLAGAGFRPRRTVVLSFGFDEEISGAQGAGRLAARLLERYGAGGAAAILDEGAEAEVLWGTPFALPGVAEKGYLDVDVVVRMPGGHSSVPPDHNGIGVMAELVTLIEGHPYQPRLHAENPYLGMLECGAAHSPDFPPRLRELLPEWRDHDDGDDDGNGAEEEYEDALALEAAKQGARTKYLFTTSQAPDIIGGGVKNNALPERTRLLVNHRVNVGESTATVQKHLAQLAGQVADKYNLSLSAFEGDEASPEAPRQIRLSVAATGPLEPAPVTPTTGKPADADADADGAPRALLPYEVLAGTSRAVYGERLLVAPGMANGNTDTRFYWDLTRHIFRYGPGFDPEQQGLGNIHTVDEHLSISAHIHGVQWYSLFIRNMDEADLA
ncbi:peptidase family M20/M25/M40 [Xylariaceae sp. FL0804]|nr:peptidase family M20/M25/M40 [Xylariaceae sp. FL0804]